jgi:cobalt-zinc-cadmium efflux system outer membrane protein
MNLFKILLCICTIFINFLSWSESYAYEPHTPRDHKYEESIYQNSKVITLEEAITLGMEFSPEVKSSKAGIAAARGLEKQAGYWKNPNFEIEAENIAGTGPYTGSNSAEYTYSLSKSIDISGKRSARKNAASQAKKAADSNFTASKLNIVRNIHVAYASVLAEAEALKLAKEQEILAKQILRTVSKRVNAARESEIQKIKATVAHESAIIATNQEKQQFNSAKQNLAKLLGKETLDVSLDHSHFFDLVAPEPIATYQEKLSNSPILKRFYYLSKEKKFAFDLERANTVSDPTVKIGIREFKGADEQALVAGLSIPLPIFNWNSGNTYSARAELDQARNNELGAKLSLEQNLIEEWKNWQISYQTADRLRNTILPTAQKAFKVAKSGYEKGKFPYLEVLDAQRTLFDARAKYHIALKQYHVARANIELITTPISNLKGNNHK